MVTVNTLKRKYLENEAKMHFTCTSAMLAVLGTFKLLLKGLNEKNCKVHQPNGHLISTFISFVQVMGFA